MPLFASLRALTAATLLALVLPAAAAEASRVASSGDEENPFDLDFTVRFDYAQKRALITREYTYEYTYDYPAPGTATPLPTVEERPEFRYTRRTAAILPRIGIGVYKDLEFHVEIPIILSSSSSWHYAYYHGQSQTNDRSATGRNDIDVNGDPCLDGSSTPTTCPVFSGAGAVYHGAGFGDLKVGLAWGILSDARDDTKPFWLVGIDFTFPTSEMYDPALDRTPGTFLSPYSKAADAGPFGENVFKIDFVTALSKRMGVVDPYIRFHATSYRPSSETYSNCLHASDLAAAGQMSTDGATACASTTAISKFGARPPWVAGTSFGAEIVTGENKAEGTRVALDFRLSADYFSSARWYNELTDATGKLMYTEDYFALQAYFGFYWRASRFMQLQATARLGTETPHFITGEDRLVDGAVNPNYDPRYDAAGRRYRLTEVSDFSVALAGVLQF